MPKIHFVQHHGSLIGIWPGKSVRKKGQSPRKEGQLYLGKVIDQAKLIFWTRKRGYYIFNPEDQTFGEVAEKDLPSDLVQQNDRKRKAPVMVDFGDTNFLHTLIYGTGYNTVLDKISCQNRDSLYAAVAYYAVEPTANCPADTWFRQNYASFLYPQANLEGQNFSAFLSSIGYLQNIRTFLAEHIYFLTQIYKDDLCISIAQKKIRNTHKIECPSDYTEYEDFGLIVVVQKSTGIPIFYEYIPDDSLDATGIQRIDLLLKKLNVNLNIA